MGNEIAVFLDCDVPACDAVSKVKPVAACTRGARCSLQDVSGRGAGLQARGKSFCKLLGYEARIPRLRDTLFENQDSILNLHRKAHGVIAHGPSFFSVLSDAELDRLCGKTHLLAEKGVSDSMGLSRRDVDVHSSSRISEPEIAYPPSEMSVDSNGNVHPLLAEHVGTFIRGGPALGELSPLFDAAAASPSNFQEMRREPLGECGSGLEKHRHSESQSLPMQLRVDGGIYGGAGGGSGYSTYEQQLRPHGFLGHCAPVAYEETAEESLSWQCLVEHLGFGYFEHA